MRRIPTTHGLFIAVDDADFEQLSRWNWRLRPHKNRSTWHVVRYERQGGKTITILMARQLLGLRQGDGKIADHIDFDGLNNCRVNLRVVTPTESMMHTRARKNSSSRFKGVCWHKGAQKWLASIQVDKKQIYLGLFVEEEKAALAYNKAAEEHHGVFAVLNEVVVVSK